MKRSVIILLVLLILGVSALGYLHTDINAVRTDVTFTETTVYGDRAVAEGLRVDVSANLKEHLHWDSAVRFAADDHTSDTDYHFTPTREYDVRISELDGISLSTFQHHDLNIDFDISELSGLTLAYRELFEATEPGTEREATIRLSDYYDYFPMEVTLELNEFQFHSSYENDYILDDPNIYNVTGDQQFFNEQELLATLQEYFRIPIPDNHIMTISVGRSIDGHSTSWGSSWGFGGSIHTAPAHTAVTQAAMGDVTAPLASEEGYEEDWDHYFLRSWCVITDDALYFTITNRTEKGQFLDMSLIPGGYGIYRLPYGKVENEQLVFCDQLSTVFPLAGDTEVVDMAKGRDGRTILLLTRREGIDHTLTVIDIATMQVISEVTLPCPGEIRTIRWFDDFLCCTAILEQGRTVEEQILVVEQLPDDTAMLRIHAPLVPAELEEIYPAYAYNYSHMDFDGERLAMVYWLQVPETYRESCGYSLAVFDKTGLSYYGEYASSLNPWFDPVDYHGEYCSPDGSRGITATWE